MAPESNVEVNEDLARQAIEAALERYPRFAEYIPRLVARPIFGGAAFLLEYDRQPAGDVPGAWDFQNEVVRGYKRLAAVPLPPHCGT